MNRQVLQLHVYNQAKQQAGGAKKQSDQQQGMAVHAEKINGRQIWQDQIGLSTAVLRLAKSERWQQQSHQRRRKAVTPLESQSNSMLHRGRDALHGACAKLALRQKGGQ